MKKAWIYIILIIFEIALGLTYGFLLQNIMPVETCLFIAFLVPFFTISVSAKEQRNKFVDWVEILALSFFSLVIFVGVFFGGNRLCGEYIGEYDVIVEYVNGRGGGCADFKTPQGEEGSVDLHDYRPIISNDDYVEVGDTIKVRKYKGLFNMNYYVFVEEAQ